MTKTRLALAALLLAAPVSSALAYDGARWSGFVPYAAETAGTVRLGVHGLPFYEGCLGNSAAEGNANQQSRPVKQYGQTSGGNRC